MMLLKISLKINRSCLFYLIYYEYFLQITSFLLDDHYQDTDSLILIF